MDYDDALEDNRQEMRGFARWLGWLALLVFTLLCLGASAFVLWLALKLLQL